MPEFLEVLFGDSTQVKVIYYGTLAALGLLVFWLFYRKLAPGPRRRRQLKEVRQHLAHGDWNEGLKSLEKARQIGAPSARWRRRFAHIEAECLEIALAAALLDKKFDPALAHAERIAELRGEPALQSRLNIQNAMLTELRRLFSIPGESRSVLELAGRVLQVSSPCREATFWQGMAHLRAGDQERALQAFQTARGESSTDGVRPEGDPGLPPTPFIDPSLYLGAVLLRQGRAKESLRYLTEANRLDANCPVVTVLLGSAIIEAGGDTNLAVKALQRGLGPRGLQIWADNPARAWVEAFPEGRSYVRRLASSFPFLCPVFGGDLKFLQLQGMRALGQGLYKLGEYQEAANLFLKQIQEGAPSLPVVRGVGLSLARIGKYDDAFKHLRAAHEMENPPERITAGFLALCGAKGTPKSDEDRRSNLAWAIKTVTAFTAPRDDEWVALVNAIFAEARAANLDIAADDQLYLAEHLLSISAADPLAAQAYQHLHATHPEAMRPEYAFLYTRAAQQHRIDEPRGLDLFALAFSERGAMEAFFGERGWSVRDVELAYLQRAARHAPGSFPAALGEDYAARGAALLGERSRELEAAGDLEGAAAVAAVLGKLSPDSAEAQDRAANLYYQRGQVDEALETLDRWRQAHSRDALPLVRRALILNKLGQAEAASAALHEALALAEGPLRGQVYFLLAELTLRSTGVGADGNLDPVRSAQARDYLDAALRHDPSHQAALRRLAALRWLAGDLPGLASLAEALDRPANSEASLRYFAALARLAGGEYARAVALAGELCTSLPPRFPPPHAPPSPERNGDAAAGDHVDWAIEAAYLRGLAAQAAGLEAEALASFTLVAQARESPSHEHAQALVGNVAFAQGDHEAASRWWHDLDQKHRMQWKIGPALGGVVFLTALEAIHSGRFEEAADRLRSAGKLGCRDRRLGQLLIFSLFRAGQKAIYGTA